MKSGLFLGFAKLKGGGRVLAAARHNKRELQNERGATSHIDSKRSPLNYRIAGYATPAEIDAAVKAAIESTGKTLRRDAVRVIEAVFSLPRDSAIDQRSYFADCTHWIGERFGVANLLSSDVHRDEAAPHCHVLFLPLVDGRLRGSDLLGGRAQLAKLADEFHAKVATLYGLPKRAPKLMGERKQTLSKSVIDRLLSASDATTRSQVWQSIRDAIERDPEPFATQLGIELPSDTKRRREKSFVAKMTATGKRTTEDTKPIGFVKPRETSNPILCRVRASAADVPSIARPSDSPIAEPEFIESQRVRDSDFSSQSFDAETGEFVEVPIRPQLQKLAAATWVNDELASRHAKSPNGLR
jgi:hypothetical protein